jgi:osmotically-inducible protein OsmY
MTNETTGAVSTREGSCNARLEQELSDRLRRAGHFELRRVSVAVDDDRVVLSGTLPSFYMKQIAQETARKVCPDRRVYNDLAVAQSPN